MLNSINAFGGADKRLDRKSFLLVMMGAYLGNME
jgi:hypothetical protein